MKNKSKRLIAVLLTLILILSVAFGVISVQGTTAPVLSYTFEDDCTECPTLFGNAQCVYSSAKGGKVLCLDGTDGTYAQIPQGFFDGRDVMTVSFDILVNSNAWNHFAFAFGQNNQVYDFFRIRNNEVRNAITVNSWGEEKETKYDAESTEKNWQHIAIVFNGTHHLLYVNGSLAAENTNTTVSVSDMGTNLISYLGKSFYDDAYFSGSFDNFEVYDRVLVAQEIKNIAGK